MGTTDLIFKLNNFKSKISAILKRHCCYSNGSCDSFFSKKSNSVVIELSFSSKHIGIVENYCA